MAIYRAEDVRRDQFWTFVVDHNGPNGEAREWNVRRLTLIELFLDGRLETPLFNAVLRFQQQGPDVKLADMPDDDRASLVQLAKRYACAAVVEPKIVAGDSDDPNELPVDVISTEVLIRLLNTPAPGRISERDAETFRARTSGTADSSGPSGEALLEPTV